jgi:phosphatidylserine decarboxylase
MLFPKAANLRFNPQWAPARPIRLGEAMADYAAG